MKPSKAHSTPALEGQPDAAELGAMVRSLSSISTELLESYDRLSARAERVDKELCRANRELGERVAEVEAILETLPVGVVVRGASGKVVRVNDALCSILGREPSSLLGSPPQDILPRHDSESRAVEYSRSDGCWRVLSSHSSEIEAEGGAGSGTV